MGGWPLEEVGVSGESAQNYYPHAVAGTVRIHLAFRSWRRMTGGRPGAAAAAAMATLGGNME